MIPTIKNTEHERYLSKFTFTLSKNFNKTINMYITLVLIKYKKIIITQRVYERRLVELFCCCCLLPSNARPRLGTVYRD